MDGEIVYKFRDWKIPFHRESLIKGIIYFASPNQFNDPFDSFILPRYDLLSEQQKTELYRESIKAENPHLNDREVEKEMGKWLNKRLLDGKRFFDRVDRVMKRNLNLYGIFSLSKSRGNILLWSHYSNSHHGFCIGYNKNALSKFVIESFFHIQMIAEIQDVYYSEDYPVLIPHWGIRPEEYIVKPLITKSSDWSYEKEVRIILYEGANYELKLVKKDIIKEVILGCNISVEDKSEIIEVTKRTYPSAKIIQAKKHLEKFQLAFECLY